MPPEHSQRYREFGDWIRSCYSTPVNASGMVAAGTVQVGVPSGTTIDRVILQEDLAYGQLVLSYHVDVLTASGWVPFSSGSAVGHKRINIIGMPRSDVSAVRFTVDSAVSPATHISLAVFKPCTSQ